MREFIDFFTSSNIALYILMSLLPILGWIYFFQWKHREKRLYVTLVFLAGMLSVLPIKLYEKYWNVAVLYFEHLNIFRYVADLVSVPEASRFLAYVAANAMVGVMLFAFVTLIMFIFEMLTGDNTLILFKEKLRKALESPIFFIVIGIFFGLIAYIFSFSVNQKIWFFVVVGMLEEFVKHIVVRFSSDEKIHSVDDAISFSIIVALGFSFVENIVYFHNVERGVGFSTQEFSIFYVLRSTISVMAHVCFSAIMGYFYGIAYFAKEIYRQEEAEDRHPVIRKLHQIVHMRGSTLFHEQKMLQGMFLAMVIHAIFNSLLEFGKVVWMIPFLLVLFFIVLHLFHRKKIYAEESNLVE